MDRWTKKLHISLIAFTCGIATSTYGKERVLILGDSHTEGGLGKTLHEGFQAALIPVSTYGLVGANPADLIAGAKALKMGATFRENGKPVRNTPFGEYQNLPPLKERLEKEQPTRVIFQFGENLADYQGFRKGSDPSGFALKKTIARQTKLVLDVLNQANPKPACTWITPGWGPAVPRTPYWKSDQRLQQLISSLKESLAGKCDVIDSTRDLGLERTDVPTGGDGLHYTPKSYKRWGDAVLKTIQNREKEKAHTQGKPCATCG